MVRRLLILYLKLKSLFKPYGYFGDYDSWDEAQEDATGYDAQEITDKVVASSRLVRDGKAGFEQDGVTAELASFHFTFISEMKDWSHQSETFRVLDFGGGLGSHYYPLKKLLPDSNKLDWNIIEQESFQKIGEQEFESDNLHFLKSIQSWKGSEPDLLLLGCVLPYIKEPYQVLEELLSLKPKRIIVDKHPVIQADQDRLTLQRIPPKIYPASYPAWFFAESKWLEAMHGYTLEKQVLCPDIFNINAKFISYLYTN